ncbi:MAG: GNAT family N-acetyltransferase [Planctomycetota bacterium]
MPIQIVRADLNNPVHTEAVLALLDEYAADPFGRGEGLADDVKGRVVGDLAAMPSALSFLAYDGEQPVGLANCFWGYSTFRGAPLVNIHDLAVTAGSRGKGVGRALLSHVADYARGEGCCGVTLEVRRDNTRAMGLYRSLGFRGIGDEAADSAYQFGTLVL